MLFRWLTERRRKEILTHPFPESWEKILQENVAHYRKLNRAEQHHLQQLTQVFLAEKSWEGCGGLDLTDEIKVTIAAEACLLLLGRDHSLYSDVESILVYPSTVVAPTRTGSFWGVSTLPIEGDKAVLGQAVQGGPVILVWDAVKRGARHPEDGHNVVFHEFAHKIDMLDGGADGTPPLEGEQLETWAEICSRAFLKLRKRAEGGKKSVIDVYGATNEAEFFAVATEAFFERPSELHKHEPELYKILKDFYNQDPASME